MTENAHHPKSAKKPRWTSLEIGLVTIVTLLFIIVVSLIALFATQKAGELGGGTGVCLPVSQQHLQLHSPSSEWEYFYGLDLP